MILDTNALSALAGLDQNLINQLSTAPRLCTTLISLGEYSYGLKVAPQNVVNSSRHGSMLF